MARVSMKSRVVVTVGALLAAMVAAIWPVGSDEPLVAQTVPVAARVAGKAEDNRFRAVTLVPMGELDEPMTMAIARDGRVFMNERRTGHIKVYDPQSGTTSTIGTVPINHTYVSASGAAREAEEGFLGLTIDPGFLENGFMYILYADRDVSKHVLARIQLRDEMANGARTTRIVPNSYKSMLEYATQRETCCHTGGGMTWDARGNLYITVGNNSGNQGFSQTDERPGRSSWDDQRGAASTNDLRGKVLRIHPEPDGTYTIPPGNLFAPGTPRTRPEIYAMGLRNAWRVSVDSKTGFVYWGEVGPDNQADNPAVGPRGYDEFNQARRPGFFGWPYFIGENRAFPYRDFVNGRNLDPKDPQKPINTSVNNTGLTELPPAQPSFIGYEYAQSEKFPELGTGGRCAVGGPVYRRSDFAENAPRPWPAYFEGKWIITDCTRAWFQAVTMNDAGDFVGLERLFPEIRIAEPMDIKFGPDGDLYVLDYGSTWFAKSEDSKLVRIEYNSGNRLPMVRASADRLGIGVPGKVTLSSNGTSDPDGDRLTYQWSVQPKAGGAPRTFQQQNPAVSFDRAGVYVATLKVTDSAGGSESSSVEIVAGNEAPTLEIAASGGLNSTFFTPGAPLTYAVKVTDREDATVAAENVAFSVTYVPEGFDTEAMRQGQTAIDTTTKYAAAKAIAAKSDCAACHQRDQVSAGPSLRQLAEKYTPDAATIDTLAAKVRTGGSGVWGQIMMPPHPQFTAQELRLLAEYFVGAMRGSARAALPLTGTHTPQLPPDDEGRGSLVFHAVYTDRGANGLPARTSEAIKVLRSPRLGVNSAAVRQGVQVTAGRGGAFTGAASPNGYLAFTGIDLTGIKRIEIAAQAGGRGGAVGGTVEVRRGSPTGELLGQAAVIAQPDAPRGGGPPAAAAAPDGAAGLAGPPQQLAFGGGRGSIEAAAAAGFPVSRINEQPAGDAGPGGFGAGAAGGRGGGGGGRGRGAGGGRGGAGAGPSVGFDLKPTAGVHDVYVVFKNERASAAQQLMSVTQVNFVQ
jgi:cytochrome c